MPIFYDTQFPRVWSQFWWLYSYLCLPPGPKKFYDPAVVLSIYLDLLSRARSKIGRAQVKDIMKCGFCWGKVLHNKGARTDGIWHRSDYSLVGNIWKNKRKHYLQNRRKIIKVQKFFTPLLFSWSCVCLILLLLLQFFKRFQRGKRKSLFLYNTT